MPATHRLAPLVFASILIPLASCTAILGIDKDYTEDATASGSSSSLGAGPATTSTTSPSTSVTTSGAGGATSSSTSSSNTSSSEATGTGGVGGGGIVILAGDMIDDMEDGDAEILNHGGRVGNWYTFNDGTSGATQLPPSGTFPMSIIPGGNASSTKAARTQGGVFMDWGLGIGFDLNHPATQPLTFDVAPYKGIAFWAKGNPAQIRVNVQLSDTQPVAFGGICTTACNDHYGMTIDLTDTWTQVVVPFSGLTQQGFGTAVAWNPAHAQTIAFVDDLPMTFDFWIDDIGFYH